MTEGELSRLYFLKIEIRELKRKIKEFDKIGLSSPVINGLRGCKPVGGSVVEDIVMEKEELKEMLLKANTRAEEELCRLEEYINAVDDAEIRLIMRLRHIDCLSWESIGDKLHMHRTTVTRKYYRYMKGDEL